MNTFAQFRIIASAVFIGTLAALLVRDLIVGGVTLATARAMAHKLTSELSTLPLSQFETGLRESIAPAEAVQRQTRQRRIDSATGQELSRRCLEFQEAAIANGSAYAADQASFLCAQYDHYVRTGQLLRQQPRSEIFMVD